MKLHFSPTWAAVLAGISYAVPAAESTAPAEFTITERAAHHRVWSRTVLEPGPNGRTFARLHTYTELATGMHYRDQNGQWAESSSEIEPVPGGAIARHGQTKVLFAANLAQAGAIEMETPDGKRLRSHFIGLSYFDVSSGSNTVIRLKDVEDQLVGRVA